MKKLYVGFLLLMSISTCMAMDNGSKDRNPLFHFRDGAWYRPYDPDIKPDRNDPAVIRREQNNETMITAWKQTVVGGSVAVGLAFTGYPGAGQILMVVVAVNPIAKIANIMYRDMQK